MSDNQERPSYVTAGGTVAAAIGVIFLCCPYGISVLAPILIGLGVTAVVGAQFGGASRGVLGRTAGIAAGLGVALVLLAAGGFLTRHFSRGDYLRYAGTEVQATVDPARCDWINEGRRGLSDTLGCEGVTWTIDGRPRTGSMEIGGEDLPGRGSKKPVQVDGYAKGDEAVALTQMDENYAAAMVGYIPLWAAGAGLLLAAGGLTLTLARTND